MFSSIVMRVGLNLQADLPPDDFVHLVRFVDDAGFDSLWMADSTLAYRHVFVYLTLAAEHSRRMTIGSAVNHPHVRHPADSLAALAAIDELSGGRAALGFGAGDHWVERAGARVARLGEVREAVGLMRTLLQSESPVSVAGTTWSLQEASLPFRFRAALPIYVAASNPLMLRLAGEVGDGAIAFVGPALGAWARSHVGTTKDFVLACGCSLDPDAGTARADAAERLEFLRHSASGLLPRLEAEPDPVQAFAIAGTPAEAVDRLHHLEDQGFGHVLLLPRGGQRRKTIELLANEVLPRLQ
jgi:5,10-methylenetetrahydromethanopterin reductase